MQVFFIYLSRKIYNMKIRISIISLLITFFCFSQDIFRVSEKQKKELAKNGDSFIVIIENILNENKKSLSFSKHPFLNNPTSYIEKSKNKSISNTNLYKDICFDCYINEYEKQLQELDKHGLTDTKGFSVTVMPLFFDQDSISIRKTYEMILSEAKNTYIFDHIYTPGGYKFVFFDESTRDTIQPRYLYFHTNKYNTGNPDLEIKGIDKYTFFIAYGNFLDFAGFWIKYINPNITIEQLSENGDEYTYKLNGDKKTIRLKKDTGKTVDNWYLKNG